jgi:hypothetical protein
MSARRERERERESQELQSPSDFEIRPRCWCSPGGHVLTRKIPRAENRCTERSSGAQQQELSRNSLLVGNMIQMKHPVRRGGSAKEQDAGGQSWSCTARACAPPPASSSILPPCIKKARPSSATPHNHAQTAQNCTSTTLNTIRPSLNPLARSPILRRSTIAVRSHGKTQPRPSPTAPATADRTSTQHKLASANRLDDRSSPVSFAPSLVEPRSAKRRRLPRHAPHLLHGANTEPTTTSSNRFRTSITQNYRVHVSP